MPINPTEKTTRTKQNVEVLLPYTETIFTFRPEGPGMPDVLSETGILVSLAVNSHGNRNHVAYRVVPIPDEFEEVEGADGKPVKIKRKTGISSPLTEEQQKQLLSILKTLHVAAAASLGFGT